MRYRKKPVVVEATQYDGKNAPEIVGKFGCRAIKALNGAIMICTLEGWETANVGDYIIRGVHGEVYPCQADIFNETYEPVK